MTDSDIEIVGENQPETVILLDSSDDSDDFFEGDERHDVIELEDHALAKSSNVTSPKGNDVSEEDDTFMTAQSNSEINEAEDVDKNEADDFSKKDIPSRGNPATLSSGTLVRSNSNSSVGGESPLKQTISVEDVQVPEPNVKQTASPMNPSPPANDGLTYGPEDDGTENAEQTECDKPEFSAPLTTNEVKDDPNLTDSDVTTRKDKSLTPPTPTIEPKIETNLDDSKANSVDKEYSAERAPSLSIEDDFFSMSYTPLLPEVKKKKKKKVKIRNSAEPAQVPITTINTNSKDEAPIVAPQPQRPQQVTDIASNSTNDVSSRKKRRLTRPVTPPPIDEEAFRRKYQESHGEHQDHILESVDVNDDGIFDESCEYKERLKMLDKITQEFANEKEANKGSGTDESRENSSEPTRQYILRITSHMPKSENHALDVSVKGTKKFQPVISKTLKYLLDLPGVIPKAHHFLYKPDQVVLYWNKLKILDFMRPDSLQIPAPITGDPTVIELGLYTKAQAEELEAWRKREREEKLRRLEQEEKQAAEEAAEAKANENGGDTDDEDPFKDDELFKGIENDTIEGVSSRKDTVLGNDESEEGFFKIGLKGEDNKKIVVKVHAETQLTSLVKHYLSKKGLPETTKAKLVFDDEDLDLGDMVGDTELEEDFTVDVIILK